MRADFPRHTILHVRDLIEFLAELAENNHRPWFVMNKPRYDILRTEFLQLVTALIKEIAKFDPAIIDCDPQKALFRIHRDMRFSKDKRPYKTAFSAALTASGLKKPSQGGGPAYYFHIDENGMLLIAGGEYKPPPARLASIRRQITKDDAGFSKVLNNGKLLRTFGGLQEGEKLSRPPKGFAIDSPHIESLKLKSLIVWKEINLKQKLPVDLKKELLSGFRDAFPLIDWLRRVK